MPSYDPKQLIKMASKNQELDLTMAVITEGCKQRAHSQPKVPPPRPYICGDPVLHSSEEIHFQNQA